MSLPDSSTRSSFSTSSKELGQAVYLFLKAIAMYLWKTESRATNFTGLQTKGGESGGGNISQWRMVIRSLRLTGSHKLFLSPKWQLFGFERFIESGHYLHHVHTKIQAVFPQHLWQMFKGKNWAHIASRIINMPTFPKIIPFFMASPASHFVLVLLSWFELWWTAF